MSVAIAVESVSKCYRIHRNRSRTLREALTRRLTGRHDRGKDLWALHDVTFEVAHGRTLGIIGHNGAGKSTLLRLLCGIGRPTSGSIRRSGPVGGLLELGTGFHPLMTGRENIKTAGILNGLTKRQVESLEKEMIAFAELEEFIDEPIRTYSSGMLVRLAFAAAIQMNPDVLLIDEVLAVGDEAFRKKCLARLDEFRRSGKTLVVISHELDQIRVMCDEVLVLEDGRVAFHAEPESAIEHYQVLLRQRTEKRTAQLSGSAPVVVAQPEQGSKFGTQEASIESVRFYNDKGQPLEALSNGAGLTIEIEIRLKAQLSDFAVSLGVYTEKDVKCFETSIPSVRDLLGSFNGEGKFRCRIPSLPLLPGRYYANAGLFPTDWGFIYDYHWQVYSFIIVGQVPNLTGLISVRPEWSAQS